ncbi:hypothetical protein JCM17846_10380 [Iodidimonas nitroreducens]|uniref:Secretin/TonB short N-terminal domain-containing protein n=1 Tax=Iodidimonas nitroreducens TaxID=1236968 RepID=A0A5A7N8M8_9PROT|nr:TonB-dependent receptor plug domain-containing protein [Iodidimonas nitroreducens]GER03356.1 hypothetical protein JCM17846_10380 [Iodidimonas nitroreducens]
MTFKTSVSAYALAMALASTAYVGSVAAQDKGPLQASAVEADTRTFEIEEQAVETALQRFAEQSGFQMAWLANDASMLNAKAVKGDYTPSAAMQILLDGTGLEFRQIDEKTIAVLTRSAQKDSQNGQDERWTRLASASGARMAGMAQATGAGQPQGAGAAQADQQMIEEVVVTGSRIRRSGTATPIPVTMLDARAIALNGDARLADTLNNLPAIGATQTLANSNDNPQEAGANFLNLRRLGIDRTLVLVNGRRHVGSRPGTTAVDVNTIPTAMVERVEVITGGASAVYGADAVSGVVNLIMRDDFQGLKLDGQVGITDEGDGESYQLSLTAGTNFDDGRGNVYFNTSYDKTRSIDALDRGYASQNLRFASNPANSGPNDGVPDQILFENTGFIGTPGGGRVVAPDTLGLFEADGGPFTFDQNGNLISQDLGNCPNPF